MLEQTLHDLAHQRVLSPQTSEDVESFVHYDPITNKYLVRVAVWRRPLLELPTSASNIYKVGTILAIDPEDLFLIAEGAQYPIRTIPSLQSEGTNSDYY